MNVHLYWMILQFVRVYLHSIALCAFTYKTNSAIMGNTRRFTILTSHSTAFDPHTHIS